MKSHSAVTLKDIENIKGHKLQVLMGTISSIPIYSGVYIWRYWPQPKDYTKTSMLDFFNKLCKEYPIFEEKLCNKRIEILVKSTHLGFSDKTLFDALGLTGTKKETFIQLLDSNSADLKAFANLIEMLIFSLPPLYIGKANCLQNRLKEHFERKTLVLSRIDNAGINPKDIYISFIKDEVSGSSIEATTLMENILQNITRPPLTKRYG